MSIWARRFCLLPPRPWCCIYSFYYRQAQISIVALQIQINSLDRAPATSDYHLGTFPLHSIYTIIHKSHIITIIVNINYL